MDLQYRLIIIAYFSEECVEKLVHATLLGLLASILFNTIIVDPYPLSVKFDSGMQCKNVRHMYKSYNIYC